MWETLYNGKPVLTESYDADENQGVELEEGLLSFNCSSPIQLDSRKKFGIEQILS